MTETATIRVLLVEDNPVDSTLLSRVLTKANDPQYTVDCSRSLKESLERLSRKDVDLVILDLSLPDSEGFETFIRTHRVAPEIPIIVLTGHDDQSLATEALRQGAQDYLVKTELDPKVLLRVMRYAMERKKVERQLKKANEELARDEKVLVDMLKSLKKSNNELKMTQLQLIQAEKLEVVGRLAAGVAHEVKNPLAMLRMGIDYFAKQVDAKNEQAKFMAESMAEAVERADFVIKGMLDFAGTQELQMEPEDLAGVFAQSLFFVKHELDRNHIKVTQAIEDGLPKIHMNRNRIEQVFINLFTNAIRAMNQGGELQIKAHKEVLKKPGGVVGFRKQDVFVPGDQVVTIRVIDSGPGIPAEILNKIFDPFFTTYRTKGGTGLGLSVVKNIIQMHHGHIEIANGEKAGVVATIMLKVD